MSDNEANIFLASAEHRGDWSRVRKCAIMGKITDDKGHDYLWVRVDPPVMGQPYGLGNRDLMDLLSCFHTPRGLHCSLLASIHCLCISFGR